MNSSLAIEKMGNKNSYSEEDDRKWMGYLEGHLRGVWFASSVPDMEDWAKDKCQEGLLKPLATLVPNKDIANGWYVPAGWSVEDLPRWFTYWAINQFGVYELNLNFQI